MLDYPDFPKKRNSVQRFFTNFGRSISIIICGRRVFKKFHPNDVDVFAGIESRGFILACALALKYNKGMVLLRKAGKLPGKVLKLHTQ